MKKVLFSVLALGVLFTSCESDDSNGGDSGVVAPATYSFQRDEATSVSYGGQTTRIAMAEELIDEMVVNTNSEDKLLGMFDHSEGESDFVDAANLGLNASDKSVKSKIAASEDFFSANTTDSNEIKEDFEDWIGNQVEDVFDNWDQTAVAGEAGNIQENGGGSVRYVNEKGLEYDQAVAKSLIGALMVDQMLNNYLSTAVLDAGENRTDNDNDVLDGDNNYTTMEHKWDEAFGYLYGADNATSPALGADSFLNKYLSRVDSDSDFSGIAEEIYNAFKLGRAAIVAKNYTVRDEQANIIREHVSKIIAIRAVYYLQAGKTAKADGDNGAAFHDLSEGYGFVYGLQFTRQPDTSDSYYTKSEVDAIIEQLMDGNGFWDVSDDTLDTISNEIASRFGFTVAEASN
ncbi:MAG: DUF4856 domain-containing protein [Flavobacteriaceae bacterium]|nr:DUF4856 domain-containing protein [Flavobacteriaceae bacterium]